MPLLVRKSQLVYVCECVFKKVENTTHTALPFSRVIHMRGWSKATCHSHRASVGVWFLPRILLMLELCMSGKAWRIFRLSSLAQTMKAFIGLLMCGSLLLRPRDSRNILESDTLGEPGEGNQGVKRIQKTGQVLFIRRAKMLGIFFHGREKSVAH